MRKHGFLGGVDLLELANLTKNFTGAEIEGLVKSASSCAFTRQIDPTQPNKPVDANKLQVLHEDFLQALKEIKPAFGVSADEFENRMTSGIIDYGARFRHLLQNSRAFTKQVQNSERTPLVSFLLQGRPGCGKTALAATLALESNFPLLRFVSSEDMVGYTESAKCLRIVKIFQDTYKSPLSVVVLDDIERLLNYVPIGHQFSNIILQTLLVCLKKTQKDRRLLIIGTTSNYAILEEMQITQCFNATFTVPNIKAGEELSNVLSALKSFPDNIIQTISQSLKDTTIPIKKIILYNEMARQEEDSTLSPQNIAQRFVELIEESNTSIF